MMATFAGHSLIPQEWFKEFENTCLGSDESSAAIEKCNQVYEKINEATENLYVYGVDYAICPEDPLNSNSRDLVKYHNLH